MQTALHESESILREGTANLRRGIESVGGKLCLTNQRLIFESHRLNIQTGTTDIPLPEIHGARPAWTKVLGFLPAIPNGLTIVTTTDKQYDFVVHHRQQWAEAIRASAQHLRSDT